MVVGASGAGKSQLLLRYTQDRFNEATKATIGVDFGHKSLNIDGKVVRAQVRVELLCYGELQAHSDPIVISHRFLQIWDTAGQVRLELSGQSFTIPLIDVQWC